MQLNIEKLIFGGYGLARNLDGKTFFVRKTVPGDLVEAEPIKDKKKFSECITKQVLISSPKRIKAACPHFEACGGCDHQNVAYKNQLQFKESIFLETLTREGIQTDVLPIVSGSKEEFYYRNTIRFHFYEEDKVLKLGMHSAYDFNKLIEIKECFLQSEWTSLFCNKLLDFINENIEDKKPFSQLRIREGKFSGEFMVEIITKKDYLPEKNRIIQFLRKFPKIKSAYHTFSQNNNLIGAKRILLYGSPIIYEKVGRFNFQISPESFFQTNSLGIKTLYDKIKEFAQIKIRDRVLDLYCGTGTIGIYLSTLAIEVVGVEIVQNAVNDATANAKINKVYNCKFVCADVIKWLKENKDKMFNKIILDPPREGLDKEVIKEISNLNFDSIIYVSCNPTTFARDIKLFNELGIKLKKAEAIDMFPQTHHIECIGLLSR